MTTLSRSVLSAIPLIALCLLAATGRSQNAALVTELSNPTNNQVFVAPANIYVHARVADTNLVLTVQYFSGTHQHRPGHQHVICAGDKFEPGQSVSTSSGAMSRRALTR